MTDMSDVGCWYTDRMSTVRKEVLKELDWVADNSHLSKCSVEPVQIIVVGKTGCRVLRDILQTKSLREELISWLDEREQNGYC